MAVGNQSTSTTVVAHFNKRSDAEQAVEELKDAGFRADQISLAVRPGYGSSDPSAYGESESSTKSSAGREGESFWTRVKEFFEGGDESTNSSVRAANDSRVTDDSTGGITRANVDPYQSDPYGYDYDREGFHGSLTSMSIPQDRANYFSQRFGSGNEGAVVVVRAAGRESEAESILENNKGDMGTNAANYAAASDSNLDQPTDRTASGTQRIQLLGEVLRVHKERIQSGEVRLRKEVVTDQQTIQVPVEREELVIERVAVDSNTPASGAIGNDKEIRIPLSEERVSVDKQNVVREEVNVGKKVVSNTQNVNDQVRHEELRVEKDAESDSQRLDPKTRRSA